MAKVFVGDLTPGTTRALHALAQQHDNVIHEIENAGADDGRFFVHLKDGWDWNIDPHNVRRSCSFSSATEVRHALRNIKEAK